MMLMVTIALSAQGKFKGFFKPVDNKLLVKTQAIMMPTTATTTWLFRPAVQVSAMQIYRNKDTKIWETATFKSAGIGLSFQHFIQSNGETVSNYGVTGLILFDASDVRTTVSPAITFSALQFFNAGVGYNSSLNRVFGLIGITYSFN
jgi:hypothetical protein